jgi:hypothetical protein
MTGRYVCVLGAAFVRRYVPDESVKAPRELPGVFPLTTPDAFQVGLIIALAKPIARLLVPSHVNDVSSVIIFSVLTVKLAFAAFLTVVHPVVKSVATAAVVFCIPIVQLGIG